MEQGISSGEVVQERKPWQGRFQNFYAPTEIRVIMRDAIIEKINEPDYSGMAYTQLAESVAASLYESRTDETPMIGTDDLGIELSRMVGTDVRLGPNSGIFINQD